LPVDVPIGSLAEQGGAPLRDSIGESLSVRVADSKVAGGEPTECAECLIERGTREASILLRGELAESFETEAVDQGVDVDEVAGLGPIEQREQLVRCEFLQRQHGSERAGFSRPDSGVDAEVDLGDLVAVGNGQADEAVNRPFPVNVHTDVGECSLDSLGELSDVVGRRTEEVKITGLADDDAGQHKRCAASKRELFGLGEFGHDASNAPLQLTQHGNVTPRRVRSQSAHARRTCRGSTRSFHIETTSSTSTKRRTSSSVPSVITCS
jgi:hypothetical protein